MILVMAFGHTTIDNHVNFIPVYAMGSSFLTAAWPSLEESLTGLRHNGYQYLPMHDTSEPLVGRYVPMTGIQLSPQGQTLPGPSSPNWLGDQSRQRNSPSPVTPPPSLLGGRPAPARQPVIDWLMHMGPASIRSHVRSHTDTSISLSSRPAVPSEISSNALEILSQGDTIHGPRTTQRRLDIDAHGQGFTVREDLSSPSQETGAAHYGSSWSGGDDRLQRIGGSRTHDGILFPQPESALAL